MPPRAEKKAASAKGKAQPRRKTTRKYNAPPTKKSILPWDPHKYDLMKLPKTALRRRLKQEMCHFQQKYLNNYEELCASSGNASSSHIRRFPTDRKQFVWPVPLRSLPGHEQFIQTCETNALVRDTTDLPAPICSLIEEFIGQRVEGSVDMYVEMAKSIEEKIDFVLQTLLKDARAILQGQKDPENPNGWEMVQGRDKPCGNWHFITERAISLLDLEPETKEKIQKRLATVFPKVFS